MLRDPLPSKQYLQIQWWRYRVWSSLFEVLYCNLRAKLSNIIKLSSRQTLSSIFRSLRTITYNPTHIYGVLTLVYNPSELGNSKGALFRPVARLRACDEAFQSIRYIFNCLCQAYDRMPCNKSKVLEESLRYRGAKALSSIRFSHNIFCCCA